MELTADQIAAARAIGLAIFPATPEQVQRLTMQKRIFRIDGRPSMVSRNGAYFETHATFASLIEAELAAIVRSREAAEIAAAVAAPALREAETSNDATQIRIIRQQPSGREAVAPVDADVGDGSERARRGRSAISKPRSVKKRKVQVLEQQPDPAVPESAADTVVPPAADIAPVQDVGGDAPEVRHRRVRGPTPPRWMTAGKARRGRLK